MNDDSISRKQAIVALKRKQDDGKGDISRFYNTIIQHDIEAIMALPPTQPEIIRCRDCDWWAKQKDSLQGRCALLQIYPTCEWFCGNARRKEETK